MLKLRRKRVGARVLSLIVAFVLLFSTVPVKTLNASTTPSVTIASVTGAPGDTVQVPITIENPGNVAGFQFTVNYDSKLLEYASVVAGDAMPPGSNAPMVNATTPGSIQIIWTASGENGIQQNGTMCTLSLRIKNDASPGSSSVVSVAQGGVLTLIDFTELVSGTDWNPVNGKVQIKSVAPVASSTAAGSSFSGKANTDLGNGLIGYKTREANFPVQATVQFADGTTPVGVKAKAIGPALVVFPTTTTEWESWETSLANSSGNVWTGLVPLEVNPSRIIIVARADKDGKAYITPDLTSQVFVLQDTQAPTGTVSINNGASRTGSTSVTLALTSTDPDVDKVKIANTQEGLASANTVSFAASVSWVLTTGSGTKTVYVTLIDDVGNESTVLSDTIDYQEGAGGGTVSINTGAEYTASTTVNLTITPDDPTNTTAYMISNDAAFTGGQWVSTTAGYNWTNAIGWDLTAGDGVKTVFVKFKNDLGQESATISDSIALDTTPPVITVNPNIVPNQVFTKDVDLSVTVQDGIDSNAKKTITLDGTSWDGTTKKLSEEKDYQLIVNATDAAGNASSIDVKFSINKQAPLIEVNGVEDNKFYNAPVTITISPGQNSVFADKKLSKDGTDILFDSGQMISDDGTYVLYLKARNEINQLTSERSVKFVIDRQAPVIVQESFQPKDNPETTDVDESLVKQRRPSLSFTVQDQGASGIDPDGLLFKIIEGSNTINATGSLDMQTGVVTVTPGNDLPDGLYRLEVTVKDKAGNKVTSGTGFGLFGI